MNGVAATASDAEEMCAAIRSAIAAFSPAAAQSIRILYGGSLKPSNARELLTVANVDGALVGGASLKATDFYGFLSVYSGT